MGHSKSRLVEDADESAPVRLESRYIGTPTSREQAGPHLPVPIISLQVPIYRDARRVGIYPEYRGFIGGIETEGRKCPFIF